jgi:hypothetical protein
MEKLGKRQKFIMLEAARRYLKFVVLRGQHKNMTNSAIGLGTWTEYKSAFEAGLVKAYSSLRKNDIAWWTVTEKGAEIVNNIIHQAIIISYQKLNPLMHDNIMAKYAVALHKIETDMEKENFPYRVYEQEN